VAAFDSRVAWATEVASVGGAPLTIDVTETSAITQRFSARAGEQTSDSGSFAWLNRLNILGKWRALALGARLDSSVYAFRPEERSFATEQLARNAAIDGATRYRDSIYPAKLYAIINQPSFELTAGDSYVHFGRGFVLSLRNVDELGFDTSIFGAKVEAKSALGRAIVVAGVANPIRVDDPSGRALFVPKPVTGESALVQPVFGADRIAGASIASGPFFPVKASTNAAVLSRCAPYRIADLSPQRGSDTVIPGFGECDDGNQRAWLSILPATNPSLASKRIVNISQGVDVPRLWRFGSVYIEGAVQSRLQEEEFVGDSQGNAFYASMTTPLGPWTNTAEFKSYRNYYPLSASVNLSRASSFSGLAYSALPTAEPITSDTMFGNFNACVTGGRDRLDYRATETFLVYGVFGVAQSTSEQPGAQCDRHGSSLSPRESTASQRASINTAVNNIVDISAGAEWRADNNRSIAFLNVGARYDETADGTPYYREASVQYSLTKHIRGPYAVEFTGRHRYRAQARENVTQNLKAMPWWQGEHQTAFKVSPGWVFTQGFEYTTYDGLPWSYINGSILYRFSTASNLRLYVGQNRGGLRCVSGVCRNLPPFSGARVELTVRF